MCLAVPGEILEIVAGPGAPDAPEAGLRTGRVSFGGVIKQVCLAYVPEAEVGAFVLVHAGFAIAQIDEAHAREALELLAHLDPAPDPAGGDA
jgi:hydrogenase expression/formation protein HypC